MRALTLILPLVAGTLLLSPGQESAPTGAQILVRMREVYVNCDTYSDSGTYAVAVVSVPDSLPLWSHGSFSTRFSRAKALRVDGTFGVGGGKSLAFVLHSSAGRHRLSNQSPMHAEPKLHEYKSLETLISATSGATGLMAATAQYTASLLVPPEFGHLGLALLANPIVEAIEPVGERLCYRVHAEVAADTTLVLWIDLESGLLRRLSRDDRLQELHRLTTVELSGAINTPISESELSFP